MSKRTKKTAARAARKPVPAREAKRDPAPEMPECWSKAALEIAARLDANPRRTQYMAITKDAKTGAFSTFVANELPEVDLAAAAIDYSQVTSAANRICNLLTEVVNPRLRTVGGLTAHVDSSELTLAGDDVFAVRCAVDGAIDWIESEIAPLAHKLWWALHNAANGRPGDWRPEGYSHVYEPTGRTESDVTSARVADELQAAPSQASPAAADAERDGYHLPRVGSRCQFWTDRDSDTCRHGRVVESSSFAALCEDEENGRRFTVRFGRDLLLLTPTVVDESEE